MMKIESKIKTTASKMFLKYGLKNVSVDDICNELQISKKTFYTYYKQKEDLVIEILRSLSEKKLECKTNALFLSNMNAIDVFYEGIKAIKIIKTHNEDKFPSFFFDLQKYYPEIFNSYKEKLTNKTCEVIKQNIIEGVQEGLYREDIDVEMMASFISSINYPGVFKSLCEKGKISVQQKIEFVFDSIIRMLLSKKGQEYYYNKSKV